MFEKTFIKPIYEKDETATGDHITVYGETGSRFTKRHKEEYIED